MKSLIWFLALALAAPALASDPQDEFWQRLVALRGQAFAGKMVEGTAASDAALRDQPMVMHVRVAGPDEIRIPFFVGTNRSRTWVLTRTSSGLRLKHDHRHEDGSEDAVTQYGGDTAQPGSAEQQEFLADELTAKLIPTAKTNIWTMRIEPEKLFGYALRRDAEGRRFRVEFDLTMPIATPLPPWGSSDH